MDLNELREELVLLGRLRLRLNRRVDNSTAPPSQVNEEQSHRQDRFRQLGIYTPEMLEAGLKTDATAPFLVEGLLQMNSLNLLVGDSGLGKTPLAIQMGICIAAGIDFLGRKVEKGPVLYCDAESRKSDFAETLRTISKFLGLTSAPSDFHVWSPNWEVEALDRDAAIRSDGLKLAERVREVKPVFVVADALRTFWSEAERQNDDAISTLKSLRKLGDVTWLLLHHRRKVNHQAPAAEIEEYPQGWFQEAAGAHALVNHSDARIGVVPHPGQGDLVLGGFIRGSGRITPLDLKRVLEDGMPVGYQLLTGIGHLNAADQAVFNSLPSRFRFKDASNAMGQSSGSNVVRFLSKCCSLAILRKEGREYEKVAPALERMEGLE